jgi:hypothetical protein
MRLDALANDASATGQKLISGLLSRLCALCYAKNGALAKLA